MNKITFNLTQYYKAIDILTQDIMFHDIVIRMIPNSPKYLVFVIYKEDLSVLVNRLLQYPFVIQVDSYCTPVSRNDFHLLEISVPLSIIDSVK